MGKHLWDMERRLIYAVVVGIVLYAVALLLRPFSEGPSTILAFLSAVVVGLVAGSVRWSFPMVFVLSFVFQIILSLNQLQDPNIVAGVAILALVNSAIFGVLGVVGGYIGGRFIWKKKT